MRLFWVGLSGWMESVAQGDVSPLDAAITVLAGLLVLIPLLLVFR